MADSQGVEKSRDGSFRDRLSKFASANRVTLITWGATLLALLGYLGWAYYAEPESLEQAIVGLTLYVCAALASWLVLGSSPTKDKSADAPTLVDVKSPIAKEDDWGEAIYPIGGIITGFITFVGSWIYCIATYGFLFGVGLGWLPSIIVAVIAGLLWPLILIVIFILIVMITK